MKIVFLPEQIEYEASDGERLMDAARRAGVLIDGNCGGSGRCGKCRVRIIDGHVSVPDSAEIAALTEKELEQGYRLACRLNITGDMRIQVPRINTAGNRKKNMIVMPPEGMKLSPDIRKYCVDVPAPSLYDQRDDLERFLSVLPERGCTIEPDLLAVLPEVIGKAEGRLTATVHGKRIIALDEGDTSHRNYGIAFDIGTTTVVGMLWDLDTGECIDVSARTNPQNSYGADVISRIHSIVSDPGNLENLRDRVRGCFNDIILDVTEGSGIEPGEIREATAVGNTTMSHLFIGVDPQQLARSPFVPVFCASAELRAGELGLAICPEAPVYLLPNIAGHVGSDIVGAILASGIDDTLQCSLLIDVGTNGEIVLSRGGGMLTCSTAAGPAFEGASIHQGMRASSGAIEGVDILDGKITLNVIDGRKPIGICGSGLIDAVAAMLGAGVLDANGRMLSETEAQKAGMPEALTQRLHEGEGGREFVLWRNDSGDEADVVITQKDVREVQLAKGAIYAGIVLLLRELELEISDLDSVILAGAFGNYIKKESALRIGLFPDIPAEQIVSAGNAAGTGACMALLSKEARMKADRLARAVRHVELGVHADFQTEFMKAMYFPDGIDRC